MPIRRAPPAHLTKTNAASRGVAGKLVEGTLVEGKLVEGKLVEGKLVEGKGKGKVEHEHGPLAVAMRPIVKSDVVVAAEANASALEQRAVRTTDPDEKRALTRAALEAWMNAANADVALGAAALHGAQANAERAAERLASMAPDEGTKQLCTGMAHALHGDLAAAAKSFEAGLGTSTAPTSTTREARSALRTALHRINDAQAAVALDDVAKQLVSARTDLDPKASAARVASAAEALIAKHPRQALAFAALAVEAHAAAGTIGAGTITLVKDAARTQSEARVPSVATKALLLAHVARLSGNTSGAFAAYRRVGEMANASEREIAAAQIARVQVAFERGRPLDVVNDMHALSARGWWARGPVAHAAASALPKAQALAMIDDAIASLGSPKSARLVDDASVLRQALVVQRRAITKATASAAQPPISAARALDALAALDVASLAKVPLAVMLERPQNHAKHGGGGGGGGARLTGDAGALVSLTAARLSLLDPVPVAQGANHASLGGLVAHVVTGQRGDSSRTTFTPLALSTGLDVARGALAGVKAPREQARVADVHPGKPPSAARLAELHAEMTTSLASPAAGAPTNGPATLNDARARLVALGWQEHAGTTSLTKDGARIAFDTFSIAQTPSFHAVLETVGADDNAVQQGRTVHVGKLVFTDSDWTLFEKGFEETMKRYQRVLHTKQGARFEAKDIDDIRTLVSMGRDIEDMPARRAQIVELAARARKAQALLAELIANGKAPKGAMIFVEGIDAASKTTNGMNLKKVFEDGGFSGSWLSFKGPSAEERQQHWLKRFQAKEPGEDAVFLSDRTFLGDHAYNPTSTDADMRAKADDVAAWERDMKAKGVLVLKLLFDPRLENDAPIDSADDILERPMLTFGKREARALIASDLLERSAGRENVDGLDAATMGPGYNDLKSFHEGSDAMERFRAFADANDAAGAGTSAWVRVGTKERHAGRLQAYDALIAQLEAWGST